MTLAFQPPTCWHQAHSSIRGFCYGLHLNSGRLAMDPDTSVVRALDACSSVHCQLAFWESLHIAGPPALPIMCADLKPAAGTPLPGAPTWATFLSRTWTRALTAGPCVTPSATLATSCLARWAGQCRGESVVRCQGRQASTALAWSFNWSADLCSWMECWPLSWVGVAHKHQFLHSWMDLFPKKTL